LHVMNKQFCLKLIADLTFENNLAKNLRLEYFQNL